MHSILRAHVYVPGIVSASNVSLKFEFLCKTAANIYVYHQIENSLNPHSDTFKFATNKVFAKLCI